MLIVLGDSHGWALERGLKTAPDVREALRERWRRVSAGPMQQARFFLEPFHVREGDRIRFTGKAAEGFQRIAPLDRDWIGPEDRKHVFGLCFGVNPWRLMSNSMWSRHAVVPVSGKDFVSRGALDAVRRHHQRHILAFWRDLAELEHRFFVIDHPPYPPRLPEGHTHTTDEEAHALFDAFRDGMIAELAALGAPFVPHPPQSEAADGTFRADLTLDGEANNHGNAAYGALVWKQIADNPPF